MYIYTIRIKYSTYVYKKNRAIFIGDIFRLLMYAHLSGSSPSAKKVTLNCTFIEMNDDSDFFGIRGGVRLHIRILVIQFFIRDHLSPLRTSLFAAMTLNNPTVLIYRLDDRSTIRSEAKWQCDRNVVQHLVSTNRLTQFRIAALPEALH